MTAMSNHTLLSRKILLTDSRYSILIFCFFVARFFVFAQNRVLPFSSTVSVYYVLSYKFGFIPRAFIGSVISLFTDFLTRDVLNIIVSIATLLFLAQVSLMLGRAIGKSEPEYKPSVILFTFFLVTAPFSHTYLIERHFGRLDIFWLIFTLTALLCLKRPYIKWLVPVLCFAAVSTHPGYMVTYMPALAIPMLYEIYRSKFSKKSIMLFSVSCAILVSLFIYFQFFSPQVGFENAEAFGGYLSNRTDMKISNSVLYSEYFDPYLKAVNGPDYFTDVQLPIARNIAPELLAYLAFSFPLIIITLSVWIASIRSAGNKFLKFIFVLCTLAPLAFIPAALFAHDWERWWAAAMNCQFIFIFYFVISKEKPLKDSLKNIYTFFENHTLILLCLFTFSGLLMLSNLCSLTLDILDKNLWHDFFAKVLTNYDYAN